MRQTARSPVLVLLSVAAALLASCGSEGSPSSAVQGTVVELPGVSGATDFDDIAYSRRLDRLLVPAVSGGLQLVDPKTRRAVRIDGFETADSADEARGLVFVADRSANEIAVVDPRSQAILAATPTAARPDYVRYVAATGELWITEPAADPPGIEIMRLGPRGEPPRRTGFITTEDGPEGLTLDRQGRRAYAHAFGGEVIVLDTRRRRELARWPIGCEEAHGFPRLDAADRLLLASCAAGGEVTLLDAASGELIDRHTTGGGESLPAYSPRTDHFYVRSDPGGTLTTLAASRQGLRVVGRVSVPPAGHCLITDGGRHYWTCDTEAGEILRFTDKDRPGPGGAGGGPREAESKTR